MFKLKWLPQISKDKERIGERAFFVCFQSGGGLPCFNVATKMGGSQLSLQRAEPRLSWCVSCWIRLFKGWRGPVQTGLKSRSDRLGSCFYRELGQGWSPARPPRCALMHISPCPTLAELWVLLLPTASPCDSPGGLPWGHFAQMTTWLLEVPGSLRPSREALARLSGGAGT